MGYMRDATGRRLDSFPVEEATSRPLLSLTPFPTLVSSTWGFHAGPQVTTAGGYEYVVYTRKDSKAVITRRKVGRLTWETPVDLSNGALLSNQVQDGHNYYAVAVDSAGYIHISGNMHNNTLKYIRSNQPNSIAGGFTAAAMVGTNESSVTYPEFVQTPSGLLFTYRDGSSGNGNTFLNRYNTGTQTWTRVAQLFSGAGESVYPSRIAVGPDGDLHVAYCWRSTSIANTNHDVCHVTSSDGGTTWRALGSSTALTLPITLGTSPIVYPTAATDSGLLNSPACDVDSYGNPHITFHAYDTAGASNCVHVWHDGDEWHSEFVTFGTYTMPTNVGILDQTIGRPDIVCSRTGRTYVLWRSAKDGKAGSFWAIDVTTPGAPIEVALANVDLYYAEPGRVDLAALRADGTLKLLLVPTPFGAGPGNAAYGSAENWTSQWGGVLVANLDLLHRLNSSRSGRPGLRIVGASAINRVGQTPITSATAVDDSLAAEIALDTAQLGPTLLARMILRVNQISGGTGTWHLTQKDVNGGNVTPRATLTTSSTSSAMVSTPWVPVDQALLSNGTGWLKLQGKSTDAGGTRTTLGTWQLAVLEDADGRAV